MVVPGPKNIKPRLSRRGNQLAVVQVRRLVAWFCDLRGCLQSVHGVLSSVPSSMQATDQPIVSGWEANKRAKQALLLMASKLPASNPVSHGAWTFWACRGGVRAQQQTGCCLQMRSEHITSPCRQMRGHDVLIHVRSGAERRAARCGARRGTKFRACGWIAWSFVSVSAHVAATRH